MKHKILITGASGAFGRLACIQLAGKGHQVVGTMYAAHQPHMKYEKPSIYFC